MFGFIKIGRSGSQGPDSPGPRDCWHYYAGGSPRPLLEGSQTLSRRRPDRSLPTINSNMVPDEACYESSTPRPITLTAWITWRDRRALALSDLGVADPV